MVVDHHPGGRRPAAVGQGEAFLQMVTDLGPAEAALALKFQTRSQGVGPTPADQPAAAQADEQHDPALVGEDDLEQ